ncbi:MAG: sulfite exporter TauE/SafE family protein [Betaproteobacteria bacterium]|nr:sulfite exporter TauE/SafE family protein [Betaproteobacteria bacterium]
MPPDDRPVARQRRQAVQAPAGGGACRRGAGGLWFALHHRRHGRIAPGGGPPGPGVRQAAGRAHLRPEHHRSLPGLGGLGRGAGDPGRRSEGEKAQVCRQGQALSLPLETLALGALIVATAYCVFGFTGFGSTVIALPLLVHLFPLKFAVSLLMLLDLAVAALFGARMRREVRLDEIRWLLPFMLGGMLLRLTVLITAPEEPLLLTLGTFVLAYAAWGLFRRGGPPPLARGWCAPIGFAGGVFSALFGTGGVLFAIYNAGRIHSAAELRATNAAMIVLASLLRLALFALAGLLTQEGLLTAASALLPAMILGFWAGSRLHHRAPATMIVHSLYALMVIAGLSLIVRAA